MIKLERHLLERTNSVKEYILVRNVKLIYNVSVSGVAQW